MTAKATEESAGVAGTTSAKLLEPGDMFGGYTVEKLLGKGGMGAVYLMRTSDGMLYAVKVMDVEAVEKNQDFLKRFLREGEFAVRIRHPNLIAVHRVGKDEKTGFCYLVMDYLPGGSLADRLDKRKRLSVEEAVSIVVQIAAALEVAHRHGVIHRDIKPDNIMFDIDGTPKLADLGVAKFTDGAHKTTVTTTGMVIGTPAYMAPEQMMDSHHVDARADIYSLGVVFYEMLAGKRPNEDSTAVELLAKAIKGDPLPDVRTLRPEVSAALAYVLSLMCAPKPENRPSTSDAVVELFQQAENGTLDVPKELLSPQAPRRQGGKRLRGSLVVVAAILVAGALGWGTVRVVQRFMSADGPQFQVVTNTVNHIVHVTNTVRQGVPITKITSEKTTVTHFQNQTDEVPVTLRESSDNKADGTASPSEGTQNGTRSRMRPSRDNPRTGGRRMPHTQPSGDNKPLTTCNGGQEASALPSPSLPTPTTRGAVDSGYGKNDMASTNRYRMVVMPFHSLTDTIKVFGQPLQPSWSCETIAAALNDNLTKTRRFTMLDRSFNAEMTDELSHLNSEKSSVSDFKRFQQLFGNCDYMVVGAVKMYPSPGTNINQWTGVTTMNDGPFLEISYRVILVPMSQLKWTGTIVVPYSACRGDSLDTAIASGMSVAAQELCRDIVDNICPMYITAKTSYELVLNQGGKRIRMGEVLDVFLRGEAIMDAMTGEMLDAPEKKIATVHVTRVDPKISYAVVAEGRPHNQIPVGAIVRRQKFPGMNTSRSVLPSSVPSRVVPPWKK